MRLADLLLSTAEDPDGVDLGQIHDARLRHSMTPDGRHRLVLEGVIVGTGAAAARLGYTYGDVRGPWVVSRIMRWFGRHSRYVEWRDLDWDEEERHARVRRRHADLPHPAEGSDDDD